MTTEERLQGALYGLFLGDALAMPVHWYYDTAALERDYGRVSGFVAPKNPHPNSILWRSHYQALNPKGEILHEQSRYWGQRGVHYHQFLQAGENTVNAKLCAELLRSLSECGGYDPSDYLRRYIDFMTTPGRHRDTYLEEYHRVFFTHYAQGIPADRCAAKPEKHIGGLQNIVPLLLYYHDEPELALATALQHLSLTHPGPRMEQAARLLGSLLLEVVRGESLEQVLSERFARQTSPLLGHPLQKWLSEPDHQVVGPRLSSACYVEDSVPATLYLAWKYCDRPEEGLIANTNLGGDNAGRGAVLGALLGAANGLQAWPQSWREGLVDPVPALPARV